MDTQSEYIRRRIFGLLSGKEQHLVGKFKHLEWILELITKEAYKYLEFRRPLILDFASCFFLVPITLGAIGVPSLPPAESDGSHIPGPFKLTTSSA